MWERIWRQGVAQEKVREAVELKKNEAGGKKEERMNFVEDMA